MTLPSSYMYKGSIRGEGNSQMLVRRRHTVSNTNDSHFKADFPKK